MELKILIIASYFICSAIIACALFSTPDMSISMHPKSAMENILGYLFYSFLCAYPWWKMYKLPEVHNNGKLMFSVLSVVSAAFFYSPITNGYDFTIGLFVIFYIISIIILFFVSKNMN